MCMPTLFKENGFRFFFYSNESQEPCHVHVVGRGGEAKLWMPQCAFEYVYGLNAKDLKDILLIVSSRKTEIEERWHEFFQSGT